MFRRWDIDVAPDSRLPRCFGVSLRMRDTANPCSRPEAVRHARPTGRPCRRRRDPPDASRDALLSQQDATTKTKTPTIAGRCAPTTKTIRTASLLRVRANLTERDLFPTSQSHPLLGRFRCVFHCPPRLLRPLCYRDALFRKRTVSARS